MSNAGLCGAKPVPLAAWEQVSITQKRQQQVKNISVLMCGQRLSWERPPGPADVPRGHSTASLLFSLSLEQLVPGLV